MIKKNKDCYVSEAAKIGENVRIGHGVYIEDNTIIEDNVKIEHHSVICSGSIIGEGTVIGPFCIIGHPTKMELQKWDFSVTNPKVKDLIVKEPITRIGPRSIIRSGTVVYRHVIVGEGLRTGHNVLIREHTIIGDRVILGTRTTLDGYIKIGKKTMIQTQCYVAQSVRIGEGVFIAPNCLFFDNKRMILGEGLNGAVVEDFVRIGGGTKVLPGVRICKYSMVGSGAIVTQDIPPKALAVGVPARVQRFLNDEEIDAYVKSIEEWSRF
jgi:acetyltransferase-like isoleucine patch superfamily enzyme